MPVKFGLQLWSQQTGWPAFRDAALAAERNGWDSVWTWDHLLAIFGPWEQPIFEGWSVLAALGPITERVRLGLMVGANTFRNPGVTVKLATTLDHVSAGRAVVGIGAAWFEREHDAFGIDFGAGFGERLDRLDEAVALIRRLLDGETISHAGRFYRVHDALCRPHPLQPRLPILIGGSGRTKTLATTARHADLWNGYGDPARIAEVSGWLRERCAEAGRPFETIRRTVMLDVLVRDTLEEAVRDFEAVQARHGIAGDPSTGRGGERLSVGGPPDLVADLLREYATIGVDEVMWILRDPFDAETTARLPEVRAALG
jgi:alkanesulfonate monooxygenase SsuD/methylene tetrahydromethanopterin reductase-like flavin-dependent oxidoreductase (luciferase family)